MNESHEWEDDSAQNLQELLKRTSKGQNAYPYPQIEFFDRKHSIWRCYNKLTPLEIEANLRHIYKPSAELDNLLLRLRHGEDCSMSFHNLPKKPKQRKNAIFAFFTCTTTHENLEFLMNLCQKVVAHEKVAQYWYNMEWRQHNPPSGLHCHIIMTFKDPYIDGRSLAVFKQFFKRKCKGRVHDMRTFPIETYLKDKLEYMKGITNCPIKNEKKKLDKIIRSNKNLKDIYTNATSEEKAKDCNHTSSLD